MPNTLCAFSPHFPLAEHRAGSGSSAALRTVTLAQLSATRRQERLFSSVLDLFCFRLAQISAQQLCSLAGSAEAASGPSQVSCIGATTDQILHCSPETSLQADLHPRSGKRPLNQLHLAGTPAPLLQAARASRANPSRVSARPFRGQRWRVKPSVETS